MRSLFSPPVHRWMLLALACQVLLVGFASEPAALRSQDVVVASESGPQCLQADLPPLSEVLDASSRPLIVPAPQPTVLPTPSPPPTPLPTPVPAIAMPVSAAAQRTIAQPTPTPQLPDITPVEGCERIIGLVNRVRQEHGLATVVYNPQLTSAAQQYADFLAQHDVLTHTADGRTLDARAEAAGYVAWVALGENLAGGYATFEEAVDAWMASLAHRDNILNPAYLETGVGCAWSPNSAYRSFFVQEFGTRS